MKLALLILAILIVLAAAQFDKSGVTDSRVLSYSIPGNLATEGRTHPVVLSLFLRVICESQHQYQIRGFAFATSVSHTFTSWFGGIFSMPPDAVLWTPQIQLRETFTGKRITLDVLPHQAFSERSKEGEPRLVMPFGLSGSLETASYALEVHIDDWDRFVYLPVGLTAMLQAPTNRHTVVLPPLHGLSAESAANLVSVNAIYHAKLGFNVMLYVAVPYMQAYAANRCIAQLQANKQLELIVWDAIPESQAHSYGHKPLCYSHALLSRWGSQDMLLMIDVDEFLAVPQVAGSIVQHVHKCISSHVGATVLRLDTVLSSNPDKPDRHWWNVSNTCGIDFMKDYGAISAYHIAEAGKSFVNSSNALAFAVHSGHTISGGIDVVEWDCLRLVHVVNLMRHRVDYEAEMQVWNDWKWVIDTV